MNKVLLLAAAAFTFFIVSCSSDDNGTNPPVAENFAMKVGDESIYSSSEISIGGGSIETGGTMRRVIQVNQSLFGRSGVATTIDSSFGPGSTFDGYDTTYFAASAQGLYIYNFAKLLVNRFPSFPGLEVSVGTPTWTPLSLFSATAGDARAVDTLRLRVGVQAFDLPVRLRPLGKSTRTINGVTYSVFEQEIVASGTLPVLGQQINLNFIVTTGGTGEGNSPSTLISLELQPINIPVIGEFDGIKQELTEFRAGS